MRTDSVITIWNRLKVDRSEVFMPTVIDRATWHYAHIVSGSEMMSNADEYSVRIPIDAKANGGASRYADGSIYRTLTQEQAASFWTIQKNDIIARGDFSDATIESEVDILALTDDCFKVSTYANNTWRGSKALKHWRAGGS